MRNAVDTMLQDVFNSGIWDIHIIYKTNCDKTHLLFARATD